MICPRCNILLRPGQKFKNRSDSWECGKCLGRAIDAALIHELLDDKLEKLIWELAQDYGASLETRCPRCQRFMHPTMVEGIQGQVEIDTCSPCKIIWFDKDEITQLTDMEFQGDKADLAPVNAELNSPIDDPLGVIQSVLAVPVPEEGFVWNDYVSWAACATILVSFWCFGRLNWAATNLGFIPATALDHRYTWITNFFVHASWAHLIGNLYFLIFVGPAVEEFLGIEGFLILLFVSTLGADLAVFTFDTMRTAPHIGASGGISGLIAFYALKFPNKRLSIVQFFGFRLIRFHISVWVAFLLFVGMQIAGQYYQGSHPGSVSFLSHLGGAAVGFLFYLFV